MASNQSLRRPKRLATESTAASSILSIVKDHPLYLNTTDDDTVVTKGVSNTNISPDDLGFPCQEKVRSPLSSGRPSADARSRRPSFVSSERSCRNVSNGSHFETRRLMASLFNEEHEQAPSSNIFPDDGNEFERALEEELSEAMTEDAFSVDMSQTPRPETSKSSLNFNLQPICLQSQRGNTVSGKKHALQQWFSNLGSARSFSRPTSPYFPPDFSFDSLDTCLRIQPNLQPPGTPNRERQPYRPASRSSLLSNRSGYAGSNSLRLTHSRDHPVSPSGCQDGQSGKDASIFLSPPSNKPQTSPVIISQQPVHIDSPEEMSLRTPNSSSPALSYVADSKRSRQSSHHDDTQSIFDVESVASENIDDMRHDVVRNLAWSIQYSPSPVKQSQRRKEKDHSSGTLSPSLSRQTTHNMSRISSNASLKSPLGSVELDRIVPSDEQPPTLLLTWDKHYRPDEKHVTDRYGFIHVSKSRKQNQTLPSRTQGTRTRTGSFVRPQSNRTDRRRSLSFVDIGHLRSQHDNNYLFNTEFKSPPVNPLSSDITPTINFTLPNSCSKTRNSPAVRLEFIEDTELKSSSHDRSGSIQNLLEHMIDAHDAIQRVQKEKWDKYLRKIHKDRRLEKGMSKDIGNDGEIVGLSTMGMGKLGREAWKEFRNLMFSGVPVVYRAKVWAECSGASQLRQPGYYDDLISDGRDTDSMSVQQIDMDINRTMPNNVFFGGKGPGVPKLRRLLLAFSRHNPSIGYCQGMNVIAATLLLSHSTEEDAFWVLVSIVEKILPEGYFTPDLITSRADQRVLKQYLKELCPKIHNFFAKMRVDIESVTFGWFLSVFTDCLPPEVLFRVWDVFFMEGNTFLWRVAIAIIKINEKGILACKSAAAIYSYLKNVTRHTFSIDVLLARCEELKGRVKSDVAIRRRAEQVERLRREMMGIIDDGG
ncbi:TBC domain-containing protein [Neolecta irregularis DAH-3]|uniref:TBC domain-containing protein n=1 Tax=Neolecta irregularis (strain DAH-3) TaxID=1198029 RepID=A0A1U7LX41_NEOID|nr:TBC domain-containing protein [Neolecta irregularis DAH-3]|eukprot:OLL27091.1 TBC domain-containing protein [Neolecta irregularis DAH-3]